MLMIQESDFLFVMWWSRIFQNTKRVVHKKLGTGFPDRFVPGCWCLSCPFSGANPNVETQQIEDKMSHHTKIFQTKNLVENMSDKLVHYFFDQISLVSRICRERSMRNCRDCASRPLHVFFNWIQHIRRTQQNAFHLHDSQNILLRNCISFNLLLSCKSDIVELLNWILSFILCDFSSSSMWVFIGKMIEKETFYHDMNSEIHMLHATDRPWHAEITSSRKQILNDVEKNVFVQMNFLILTEIDVVKNSLLAIVSFSVVRSPAMIFRLCWETFVSRWWLYFSIRFKEHARDHLIFTLTVIWMIGMDRWNPLGRIHKKKCWKLTKGQMSIKIFGKVFDASYSSESQMIISQCHKNINFQCWIISKIFDVGRLNTRIFETCIRMMISRSMMISRPRTALNSFTMFKGWWWDDCMGRNHNGIFLLLINVPSEQHLFFNLDPCFSRRSQIETSAISIRSMTWKSEVQWLEDDDDNTRWVIVHSSTHLRKSFDGHKLRNLYDIHDATRIDLLLWKQLWWTCFPHNMHNKQNRQKWYTMSKSKQNFNHTSLTVTNSRFDVIDKTSTRRITLADVVCASHQTDIKTLIVSSRAGFETLSWSCART